MKPESPKTVEDLLSDNVIDRLIETSAVKALIRPALEPRGLTLSEAAAYCGVSIRAFHKLVSSGLMPTPVFGKGGNQHGQGIWDRRAIDIAFDRLSSASRAAVPRRPGIVESHEIGIVADQEEKDAYMEAARRAKDKAARRICAD